VSAAHETSIHQPATTYDQQLILRKLNSPSPNQRPLPHTQLHTMSFLFGGARPQPSSAEKIAAAEAEIEMVSNMFNQ
jgi:hypothetical protein